MKPVGGTKPVFLEK